MTQASTLVCAATLRSITYRLAATPSELLPRVAVQIASSVWNCRQLLSLPSEGVKQNSESAVVVTRYRTHLASLLQDRTVEGRWAAVVLVKATIEAGGVETLSKSSAWVKCLLTILKKPDPPATRSLAIITLTRIFSLTWAHTNLVREITTPSLPGFVSTCLSNIENTRCSGDEALTILESFAALIHRHPTIFRTSETQIRGILSRIVSDTVAHRHSTVEQQNVANRVSVLLHHCAPKQGFAEQQELAFRNIISSIHKTCDGLFRSIVENWQSTTGVQPSGQIQALHSGEAELEHDEYTGLAGWSGVSAGIERLMTLLDMLRAHMGTASMSVLTTRLGLLTDVLSRVLNAASRDGVKHNPQIAKDEREILFSMLPCAHVLVLRLIDELLDRFERAASSMLHPLLSQVMWLFQAERWDIRVRSAVYTTIRSLLRLQGLSMARDDATDLQILMKSCCEDLLLPNTIKVTTETATARAAGGAGFGSVDVKTVHSEISEELAQAAGRLLPELIANVNPSYISRRLRAQLERTAVLTYNKDALLACVLSPMNASNKSITQPSLLPVLARQFTTCVETEVLLRPRMPVIKTHQKITDDEQDAEHVEDGVDEDGYETAEQDMHTVLDEGSDVEGTSVPISSELPAIQAPMANVSAAVPQPGPSGPAEKRPASSEHFDFSPYTTKRPRISPESADKDVAGIALLPERSEIVQADQQDSLGDAEFAAFKKSVTVPSAMLPSPSQFAHGDEKDEDDDDDDEMEIPLLTMEDSSDEE